MIWEEKYRTIMKIIHKQHTYPSLDADVIKSSFCGTNAMSVVNELETKMLRGLQFREIGICTILFSLAPEKTT